MMASIKSLRKLCGIVLADEVYFTDRPDFINYLRGSGTEDVNKTKIHKKVYRPTA